MIFIYMDITGIDLFDEIVSMACAKVRLRCSVISPVLIDLYKMSAGIMSNSKNNL